MLETGTESPLKWLKGNGPTDAEDLCNWVKHLCGELLAAQGSADMDTAIKLSLTLTAIVKVMMDSAETPQVQESLTINRPVSYLWDDFLTTLQELSRCGEPVH